MPKTNRNIPENNPTGHISPHAGTLPSPWRPSPLGAAPLPLVIGAVAALNALLPAPAQLSKGLVFEPPYLNTILQVVFLALTSYAVVYISLKSYLQTGSPILVLLGSGALAWGSASLLAGVFTNLASGPNVAISISNTGALVASILHVTSGAMASAGASPASPSRLRKPVSVLAYGGVLVYTTVFALACLLGAVPAFFVPGVGQTAMRMAVLGTGAGLFAVSSLIFAKLYFSSKSRILYWYFLALGLTSVGLGAVFFGRAPGDPISWTGRFAMFLGGVYFLKAVLTTFAGSHRVGT